ncbi:MAG: hypothetical protein WC317_07330 [Candidatus Omnitrophota bacterium]|jgi:hypothetical protein
MKNTMNIICILSLILLGLLGCIGDNLLNTYSGMVSNGNLCLPSVLKDILGIYGMNEGNFVTSLTPFMIIMVWLTVISKRKANGFEFFIGSFVIIWSLVLIYFFAVVLLLTLPFQFGITALETPVIRKIVMLIDALIICALILFSIKRHKLG